MKKTIQSTIKTVSERKQFLFILSAAIIVAFGYQNCAPTGNAGGGNAAALSTSVSRPYLTISPSNPTLTVGVNQQFLTSGGVEPYTYTVVSGTGTITSTGYYSAPSIQETDLIQVKDTSGLTENVTVGIITTTTVTTGATPVPTPTPAPAYACTFTGSNNVYLAPGAYDDPSGILNMAGDLGYEFIGNSAACLTFCAGLHATYCEYFAASSQPQCDAFSAAAAPGGFTDPIVTSGTCR